MRQREAYLKPSHHMTTMINRDPCNRSTCSRSHKMSGAAGGTSHSGRRCKT
jgi:hypothetical protein